MPEPFFPLFLQLTDRPCLLIGGGATAVEKGNRLLAAGARLTVVAPRLVAELQLQVEAGRISWLSERFRETHLEGIWFAVSTLTDAVQNSRIYAEANRRRLFLNVVDQPDYCSCHWPATLERPPVTVAFSTRGESPALASYLRRTMAKVLPETLGELAHWLSAWRQRVQPVLPDLATRGQFWRALFDQGVAEQFLSGDVAGADALIQQALAKEGPMTIHAANTCARIADGAAGTTSVPQGGDRHE
ncbi:MAG: bifunctional precorrin-2 dehydrogenase/sirohydrochlorin ferrochelatase [Magnetococcales bacterium]|nr:bifunctional precorrin-2 dehydrogenase/sirohydrochlorin ferrochelatase [Magnetococcales bacterium]